MKRTPLALALVLVLLFSALPSVQFAKVATANPIGYLPPIVIKNDGSVVPETEFIRQDGNVYTLTADLPYKYYIRIQCSNIVFDGAGHVISGYVGNDGLSLESVTNVTVRDVQVYGFGSDISIGNCSRSRLIRITASRIGISGSQNTVTESSVGQELTIGDSENLVVGNTIAGLNVNGETNIFAKNNVTGLFSAGGFGNRIIANRIAWLHLWGFNNTLCANEIGDRFRIDSLSNLFYDNNFGSLSPLELTTKESGPFYWDNGVDGNFWIGYNGSDANHDGVGDSPFIVDAEYFDDAIDRVVLVDCGYDRFPLMSPFDVDGVSLKLPDWSLVADPGWVISFLSPLNIAYSETEVWLNFTVPDSAGLVRFSLDGGSNVTVAGNTSLAGLSFGVHTVTLYVDDLLGSTTSETICFSVEEPFPAVPVAAASSAVIVAVATGAGLILYRRKNRREAPQAWVNQNAR